MSLSSEKEKSNRVGFLISVAQRAIDYVVCQTEVLYGAEQAAEIRQSLTIDRQRIEIAVNYYYDNLLYEYKNTNGYFDFEEERKSGRDKLAALTVIALLTFSPIIVRPYDGPSVGGAEIGEIYALFFASTVLHVGLKNSRSKKVESGDLRPSPHIIVVRNMLLNLRDLGIEARRRARQGNHVRSTEPLADWVIQSMQLYALKYGKIDLRFD
jgi:hypothetical protein